jgi:hypothetical protein
MTPTLLLSFISIRVYGGLYISAYTAYRLSLVFDFYKKAFLSFPKDSLSFSADINNKTAKPVAVRKDRTNHDFIHTDSII